MALPFIITITRWTAVLVRLIPNWQRVPVGFKWLWSMILPIDIEFELALQGVNDWAPGSPNASLTALPYIANSRGLIQGEAETAAHFAARLVNWRTNGLAIAPPAVPQVWSQRGNTRVLALQVQQFLANTPTVRIIERLHSTSGTCQARYVTANPDGSISDVIANWDWDSSSGWTGDASTGTVAGSVTRTWWSDFWIVIYPAEYPVTGTQLSALVPIWGSTSIGLGHAVPVTSRDAILSILRDFKGAHCFCRAIIWSYDATLFDPASPSASGDPDGTWGPLFNRTGHADGRVRYWEPNGG